MPQTVICQNESCQKPFVTKLIIKPPRYCSKECFYRGRETLIPCAYCGELYNCSPSEQAKGMKCCSKECRIKNGYGGAPKGENHPNWQGKRRDAICENCSTPFVSILHPETGWSRFCGRKCKGKAHSLLMEGENNKWWKGGKSREPYPIEFNNRLRKAIRERDNYICQLCGVLESNLSRKLDIHHIDYCKENLLPKNLLALCRSCNSKVNHNRDYWRDYFMSRQCC